ncbi:MAG: presqualene diphosphate synthase HpnD [Caulobacteraceae bacterium]|nr:presqualene diphosphate synthase HpnD [Caulobacter sp.]
MPAQAEPSNEKVASGSSFYAGMRILPPAERAGMYAVYGFCRVVDDIADDLEGDRAARTAELDAWRADLASLYAGGEPGRAELVADAVRRFDLRQADFLAILDGMQADVSGPIRAPSFAAFDLYCDQVASAVGRLSVRVFGMPEVEGVELAYSLGRALQFTNVLRDLDEDAAIGRLYMPRELLREVGIEGDDPRTVVDDPRIDAAARALAARAREHYEAADLVLGLKPPGKLAAPRLMSAVYGKILARMDQAGWAPPRERVRIGKRDLLWIVLRRGLLG